MKEERTKKQKSEKRLLILFLVLDALLIVYLIIQFLEIFAAI
jgi:hypothetical protein